MASRCATFHVVLALITIACATIASVRVHAQTDSSLGLRLGAGVGVLTFDSADGLSGPSLEIDATIARSIGFARVRLRYHHLIASDSAIAVARLGRGIISSMIESGWYVVDDDKGLRPFASIGVTAFGYREHRGGSSSLGGPTEARHYRFAPHIGFGAEYRLDPSTTAALGGTLAYILGAETLFRWVGGISASISMTLKDL